VAPRQQVVDHLLTDQTLAHQQPQHLGAKQLLDQVRVEEREALQRPVASEHPVGDQQVHVRMEVQQLAGRLDEPDGARHRRLAVAISPPMRGDGHQGRDNPSMSEMGIADLQYNRLPY